MIFGTEDLYEFRLSGVIGIPDETMYPRPRKSIDEVLIKR